jgi:hypothetical protein
VAVSNVLLISGSANFSTRDVWDGYRLALEAAGVRVIPYPTFSFLKVLSGDSVCNDILGTALDVENRIDCVIFVDGLFFRGKRARVPLSIRRAGIPTVLVATDDPYESLTNVESLYTYRFTNEIRCATEGAAYLPTATLPLPVVPWAERPRYDVSFLGTVFADRLPLLVKVAEFCEAQGRRFLVAGKILEGTGPFDRFTCTDVRQRTIDTVEKWEIYSQSRLALNLFRRTELPADSPSPRVFEVTAFGHAALLTGPTRSEVTRIFGDNVYHFADADSALAQIERALKDESDRRARVVRAREITLAGHLYEHRAAALVSELRQAEQERSVERLSEDRIAWIIGCGRTGSTWLADMLGDLPKIRRWHEPYFGRFFRHLHERPDDLDRQSSFFSRRHQKVWLEGLRDLFFKMVRDRYPQFGRHALVVKEVNTPEVYGWLRALFPATRLILLVRDPFDILDSYLDLQRPGSWNERFGDSSARLSEANVRRTAEHIRSTFTLAIEAYEGFPIDQRLQIAYQDLLGDPVGPLVACGELLSLKVDPETARKVAQKHDFQKQKKTGTLEFRRSGKAGVWKSSENFTPEVLRLAEEVLGPLRGRLGYQDVGQAEPAQHGPRRV